MSDQTGTGGPIPHLLLVEVTDGKQRAGQLGLVESVQKITLILIRVAALEQVLLIVARLTPDIVAGGDPLGAQSTGVVEESPELDFGVAQDVRVGGSAATVFVQKIAEHPFPIFGGEADLMQGNAQRVANRACVLQILGGGTVTGFVGILPIFHEHAMHIVALFDQQQGGHRGIHAAGQAHHDPAFYHWEIIGKLG